MTWISCLVAGVVLGGAMTAHAWDPIGHMIVGESAYARLTPAAREQVDRSMAAFNKKHGTDYTFASANCWMDDIRGTHKEFGPWHYINLPFTPEGEPFPPEEEINALRGILYCRDVITGTITDPQIDKDQALVMLAHLIGDIHQPLHTVSRNQDAGGNKVAVTNIKDAMVEAFPNRKNLHYFWDCGYRRVLKDGEVVEMYGEPPYLPSKPAAGHNAALPLVREQVDLLEKAFQPDRFPVSGTPRDWIKESHAQGYDAVYQKLPGGEGANPATLDQAYVDQARELTRQKLIQAGHRLADTLNELYQ